jgi:SAM-dependent methyltransferase
MPEVSTMPFHGLLGGKLGMWLLERCAAAPAHTHAASDKSAETHVDETPRLSALFGERFTLSLKGCTVLDYGCGYGHTVVSLAKSEVALAMGMDIRESVLQAGRALALVHQVKDRCIFMNAHDTGALLTWHGGIDIITSIDGFEHYADPKTVLQQMWNLLRPGGLAFISFGPPWWHPYGAHLRFMGVPPWTHVFFTERTIMALRARYRTDGAQRFEEVEGGLNRMTIGRFERVVRDSGFDVDDLHLVPIRGTKLIAGHWWGRELFTSMVMATLVKPSQSHSSPGPSK